MFSPMVWFTVFHYCVLIICYNIVVVKYIFYFVVKLVEVGFWFFCLVHSCQADFAVICFEASAR